MATTKTTKRNRLVNTTARTLAERGKPKLASAVTRLLASPARGTRVRGGKREDKKQYEQSMKKLLFGVMKKWVNKDMKGLLADGERIAAFNAISEVEKLWKMKG